MEKEKRNKFDKKALKVLYKSILELKNSEEVERFLKSLMSPKEIKNLARRILAVKKLYEGATYIDLFFESGMSMSTINKMHFKTKGSKLLRRILS